MKIVVNRSRNTRQVITEFEQLQLFDSNNLSHHIDAFYCGPKQSTRYDAFEESSRYPNRYFERTHQAPGRNKRYQRNKERHEKYRMMLRIKRDFAITNEKFARLSVSTPTNEPKDDRIKDNAAVSNSQIRLREPVLQFSRSYEEASSSSKSISAVASSISTEKTDSPSSFTSGIIEIFKCKMCPVFAIPEVFECPSGHIACNECSLLSCHCTLCSDKGTYRRVHGMERIASLLIFPCRWRHRGCLESMGPRLWHDHVDTCQYAEVVLNQLTSSSQVSTSDDDDIIDISEFVDL